MSVLKFISLILLSLLIFVSFHCRPTSSWFQAPMLHGIDIWIDVQGCCHWSVFITHCATDEKEGFNFNKFEQGLVVTMLDDHWIKIIQMFQALPTLTIYVVITVHSVEKWKIYSHQKNISSNQLFSNFISKTVVLTKFLPKKRESKIPVFPQCEYHSVEITEIYSHTFLAKISWKQRFY